MSSTGHFSAHVEIRVGLRILSEITEEFDDLLSGRHENISQAAACIDGIGFLPRSNDLPWRSPLKAWNFQPRFSFDLIARANSGEFRGADLYSIG